MKDSLVIQVPSKKKIWIFIQIIFVYMMLWFRDVIGLPSVIVYLTDIVVVLIIILQFRSIKQGIKLSPVKPQLYIVGAIVLCMILGAVVNLANPILFLWGFRNNIRFFVFFFLCVALLSKKDIKRFISIFKVFFVMNVVMISFQYFVQGYRDDFLGGFFGVASGCNAYVCVTLCIITAIVMAEFNSSEMTHGKVFIYCVACMYVATVCELKIYFLEFVLIVVIQLLYTKPSKKTIGICIAIGLILVIGFNFIKRYNPAILKIFVDNDAMEYYLSGNGYTNSGDLNRLTAVQKIYSMFFRGDRVHSLFGFGLGSCDYSNFSFLQSAFYKKYEYLHYRWFSHSWVYLEQGSVGLILLISFFVSIAVYIIGKRKQNRNIYDLMVFSFLPTCLIGLIYNNALEMETAYIIALMCALPFIAQKQVIYKVSSETFQKIQDMMGKA